MKISSQTQNIFVQEARRYRNSKKKSKKIEEFKILQQKFNEDKCWRSFMQHILFLLTLCCLFISTGWLVRTSDRSVFLNFQILFDSLDHEEFDLLAVKKWDHLVVHEYHSPLESREPKARIAVWLVLTNYDRVWHRKETDLK